MRFENPSTILTPLLITSILVDHSPTGLDIQGLLGRIRLSNPYALQGAPNHAESIEERWRERKATFVRIPGRYVFNGWRLMRSEASLTLYTLENVVYHVLKKR